MTVGTPEEDDLFLAARDATLDSGVGTVRTGAPVA